MTKLLIFTVFISVFAFNSYAKEPAFDRLKESSSYLNCQPNSPYKYYVAYKLTLGANNTYRYVFVCLNKETSTVSGLQNLISVIERIEKINNRSGEVNILSVRNLLLPDSF